MPLLWRHRISWRRGAVAASISTSFTGRATQGHRTHGSQRSICLPSGSPTFSNHEWGWRKRLTTMIALMRAMGKRAMERWVSQLLALPRLRRGNAQLLLAPRSQQRRGMRQLWARPQQQQLPRESERQHRQQHHQPQQIAVTRMCMWLQSLGESGRRQRQRPRPRQQLQIRSPRQQPQIQSPRGRTERSEGTVVMKPLNDLRASPLVGRPTPGASQVVTPRGTTRTDREGPEHLVLSFDGWLPGQALAVGPWARALCAER